MDGHCCSYCTGSSAQAFSSWMGVGRGEQQGEGWEAGAALRGFDVERERLLLENWGNYKYGFPHALDMTGTS